MNHVPRHGSMTQLLPPYAIGSMAMFSVIQRIAAWS